MSSVELAADYANRMIEREARGPGDTEHAMHRLETATGIGYWTWWALRYRRRSLKTVTADQFHRIRAAYLTTCERQIKALQHDLEIERAKGGDDDFADLVVEAEGMVARLKRARTKVALPSAPDDGSGE